MKDRIYICDLYDYYKSLLTYHQCICFEDYYFDNLTMIEIAENMNISKNAVSKTLKEVVVKLKHLEENLHLYSNKKEIEKILTKEQIESIIDYI